MDEELEQRLVKGLDKISEWVESSESFVSQEAPLVAQELLAWGIWGNVVMLLAAGIVFVVCWVVRNRMRAHYRILVEERRDPTGAEIGVLVATICQIALLFPFVSCIFEITRVVVAPRVYILQRIGDLF